jgi:hypothetical protein
MIKLTKIDINPNSQVQHAETVAEYREGMDNARWDNLFEGKSPPVDYYVVGNVIGEIVVGRPVMIDRWNRNGVVTRGAMTTSPVTTIEKNSDSVYITTANSLYKLEEVSDEEILTYA